MKSTRLGVTYALTPNTVLIPTLGAFFPRGKPVQTRSSHSLSLSRSLSLSLSFAVSLSHALSLSGSRTLSRSLSLSLPLSLSFGDTTPISLALSGKGQHSS